MCSRPRTLFSALSMPVAWAVCLLQGSCIYANVVLPLAYRSPTPADIGGVDKLGGQVEGMACNHMVLGLVAWGDGGYAKALANASEGVGAKEVLVDVQADSTELNVLSLIYNRRCTVVHARVSK